MALKGPPKSPRLKVMQGGGLTLVQPDGTAAAAVAPMAPAKPAGVAADEELSTLWDEVVPELDRAGMLSTADVATVEMALRHLLAARKAHRSIMRDGLSIMVNEARPEHGMKKNPDEAVFRLESAAYLEYAKQLGMTWMSRARTAIPKGDNDSGNPFGASEAASG